MSDTPHKGLSNQPTSEELIDLVAEGDEYAFKLLVIRHQAQVLNLSYRILLDRQKSEDIAQETFLQVWRSATNYQGKSKFATWLYRITVNLCLKETKSAQRRKWLRFFHLSPESHNLEMDSVLDESPNPEELVLARELGRQLTDALQSLPENQRIALILKRYDSLSYEEISRILSCSVSAVESLMVRAKRTLQQKLKYF